MCSVCSRIQWCVVKATVAPYKDTTITNCMIVHGGHALVLVLLFGFVSEVQSLLKQNKPIWIHKPHVHYGPLPISEAKTDCAVKRLTQSSIRWWFILSKICWVTDLSQVSHALGVSTILKMTRWMIRLTLLTFSRQPGVCQEASRLCW